MSKDVSRVRGPKNNPAEILAHAVGLYLAGSEAELCSALEPLSNCKEKLTQRELAAFLSLSGLGSAHTNKLIDAESAAVELSTLVPNSPDPWFVLTFVHLSMREYTKAIEAGEKYRRVIEHSGGPAEPNFCSGEQHRSQVLNMMAVAAKESGKLDDAIAYYQQSIAVDPGNHLPYLNLATLLTSIGDRAQARQTVSRGLKQARQVHELRLLEQSVTAGGTVSACMIVKNEQDLLGDCLASIRDWVDEIIVVDTGSSDGTVKIAESYGARVYHHPWECDFSKARNQSLSYATCDWIFIVDADERIYSDDVPHLQKLLKDERAQVISINVYNVYGDGDTGVTFLPSTRLFRRSLGLRYDGIVHNVLVYPETQPILRTGIRLRHLGYGLDKEKMRKKFARSKELLEKQLAEAPDNAFALFNYAQLLRGQQTNDPNENSKLIIGSAEKAIALTNPSDVTERHIHLMCLDQIGWTYFRLGEYQKADEFANRALSHKPNYLDPLLLLAHSAARRQEYALAKTRYADYLKAQGEYDPTRETDNIIMLHVDSRVTAWYSMGMIAEIDSDFETARKYYEQVVAKDPNYLETNAHLGRLALKRDDLSSAEKWYRRQIESHPESIDGYRQLGSVLLLAGNAASASEIFAQGLKINGNDKECLVGLARAKKLVGDIPGAVILAQRAVKADSEDRQANRVLADVLYQAGRFEEAMETLDRLLAVDPNDVESLNDLGNCCFKLKRFAEAESYYQQVLPSEHLGNSALLNIGLAQVNQGRLAEASQSLSRYLVATGDDLNVINILADISFRMNEFPESLGHLEKILKSQPDNLGALLMLSDCYLNLGHRDSAIIGYRRILKLDPTFAPAEQRLAGLAAPVSSR